jgi:hypothetical protein
MYIQFNNTTLNTQQVYCFKKSISEMNDMPTIEAELPYGILYWEFDNAIDRDNTFHRLNCILQTKSI